MPARTPARSSLASIFLLALALAGCGDDDGPTANGPAEQDPLPGVPANDTPQNLMTRFEASFESQVLDAYGPLFTADFHFRFSNQSDPDLVTQYGLDWGKVHELTSVEHLFDGFTNEDESFVPGATDIQLSLSSVSFIGDPNEPDSTTWYRYVIVANTSMILSVPGADAYQVTAPHDFYLVRGDAAVLAEGQVADSTRWYIRRWDDKSPALGFLHGGVSTSAGALPASPVTWGRIKAQYRM